VLQLMEGCLNFTIAPRFGSRCQAYGQDVETVGESRPEPKCLEKAGWWAVVYAQKGPQAYMR
ncbi:hypothetical protein BgiBS90_009283, partial [Biomphalaria glabrata]